MPLSAIKQRRALKNLEQDYKLLAQENGLIGAFNKESTRGFLEYLNAGTGLKGSQQVTYEALLGMTIEYLSRSEKDDGIGQALSILERHSFVTLTDEDLFKNRYKEQVKMSRNLNLFLATFMGACFGGFLFIIGSAAMSVVSAPMLSVAGAIFAGGMAVGGVAGFLAISKNKAYKESTVEAKADALYTRHYKQAYADRMFAREFLSKKSVLHLFEKASSPEGEMTVRIREAHSLKLMPAPSVKRISL